MNAADVLVLVDSDAASWSSWNRYGEQFAADVGARVMRTDDGGVTGDGGERQAASGTAAFSPVDWVGKAWRISSGLPGAALQAVHGAFGIVTGLLRPAAGTSLTGPVTSMRRYATGEVSLDDVDSVCREFGVTVNDVALAAITDSFRNTLIRRGEK
nr:wax ester/triacylglycerol synthase family O-acyltransferase [Streptomyces sp. DSM 41633]